MCVNVYICDVKIRVVGGGGGVHILVSCQNHGVGGGVGFHQSHGCECEHVCMCCQNHGVEGEGGIKVMSVSVHMFVCAVKIMGGRGVIKVMGVSVHMFVCAVKIMGVSIGACVRVHMNACMCVLS